MATRIFLCNEREVPDIRDYIREAKKDIAAGEDYIITWSCANIKSVQVGDKAYFKRADRSYDGYFASGYIVPAEKKYQLRLKDRRYQNLSEAYDVELDRNNFMVWIAWDECIDYDYPLRISTLKQIPEFSGISFDTRIGGEVFPEVYTPLLEDEWEYHLSNFTKSKKSIRLVDMYVEWGRTSNQQQLHEDAIDYYSQAIDIKPNCIKAYVGLGNAHQALGEHEDAIAHYTSAIRLGSIYDKVAYCKRGSSYYRLKEFKKAIRDYSSVLQIDPKYLEAHLGLGECYYKLKQYEKAIAAFSKTTQLDPKSDRAFYYRGRSHFTIQEYEAAIRDFNHALSIKSDIADAYYYRGIAYSKPDLGDEDTALHDLERAAKLCKAQGRMDKFRKVQDMIDLIASERADNDASDVRELPASKGSNAPALPSFTSASVIKEKLVENEFTTVTTITEIDLDIDQQLTQESLEPLEDKEDKIESTIPVIDLNHYDSDPSSSNHNSVKTPQLKIAEPISSAVLPAKPEKQRELDILALETAIQQYQADGWQVETVELRQAGYNLVCTRDGIQEDVNVKGVVGDLPMFMISAREVEQAQHNPNFVLWAVTSILDHPNPRRWSGAEMLEKYNLKPVKYLATLK